MKHIFNTTNKIFGNSIEQPSTQLVKNTLTLFRASIEDSLKYGGELTRETIHKCKLFNSRKYCVVDTKVHMLMSGFCPAIPGWHTDGVPRDKNGSPSGPDNPNLELQKELNSRNNIYHLLVTGTGCLTKFLHDRNISIDIPENIGTDLYKIISQNINSRLSNLSQFEIPSCQFMTWDWWELHSGIIATKKEWRFLIRVTETDFLQPQTNIENIIRTQNQVYVPMEFGW